ncbi:MAG: tRNA uridine-5-carboxymethylaminomethyl(34) synthesis GTPase MnmE [Gemmatimonadetes bacterium]|nr:tRNA uridine-5-carboxymethylaminomethyl(34) synthesis GTPase MnmE [Gemmatimonadota bacterium]
MPSSLATTIAAIATPAGRGAVALVRISGADAAGCLLRVCPALGAEPPAPRVQRLLVVRHPDTGDLVDRALVSYFPAPHSYTGEDTVEISTHGGVLTPQLVLAAVCAAGAVVARPGEFTHRALDNGKLDLLQAEAVLDLVEGRSPALHRAAIFQMERGLSRRIEELRAAILHVEALLTYSIDFPEEDEPPVPPARTAAAAREITARIRTLLATAPQGEMLREGALVVLAGLPNSGKSSLFNALLGTERAIVTEIPGTTRDALEASIVLDGYPFRLADTAGLRETTDRVEGIGIEVARRYLRAANIVLFCADAARDLDPAELGFLAGVDPSHALLVRTKADELGARRPGSAPVNGSPPAIAVSVVDGTGLARLREELLRLAFGGILGEPGEAPLVTRERHARALGSAMDELTSFVTAVDGDVPPEIAATHLAAARDHLEELIGAVTPDEVLGQLFAQFCIGK